MSEELLDHRLEEARILKICYVHRNSLGIARPLKEDPTNKCEDLDCVEGCSLVRGTTRKWRGFGYMPGGTLLGIAFMLILCAPVRADDVIFKQDGLFPDRINIFRKGKVLPEAHIERDGLFDEYVIRDRRGRKIGTAKRDGLFPDRWNFKFEKRRRHGRGKHKRSFGRRNK